MENKKDRLVGKNLEWLIEEASLNPHILEQRTGVPQPTIHRILSGESADPRTSTLKPIAEYFGVTVAALRDTDLEELSKGGLQKEPFYYIPHATLRLSAGINGFSLDNEGRGRSALPVFKNWVDKNGFNPELLVAIKVKGESMEPSLYEGDLVVVNTGDRRPLDGAVYAVNYEGEPVVKRLSRDAGRWWLTSDNPDQRKFHRKLCDGDACIIVGKVVLKESEKI